MEEGGKKLTTNNFHEEKKRLWMTGQNENCCKHKGPFLSFLSNSWLKPSAKSTHFIAMVRMLVFFNVFLAVDGKI